MPYETLLYGVEEQVATITLNRPEALNTIVPPMPDEVEAAVEAAVADEAVKVIVLRGAGRSFCAGFDFSGVALAEARRRASREVGGADRDRGHARGREVRRAARGCARP